MGSCYVTNGQDKGRCSFVTYFDTEGKKERRKKKRERNQGEREQERLRVITPKFGKHLAGVHVGGFRACRLSHAGRHRALHVAFGRVLRFLSAIWSA